ncbi:hypothetical protein HCH_00362 [Hahella chejuensis KCTC 2396]|uniref:Peptidase S8/S53 domain-containing protein n=1 Tax=Hahella chejuensis (strain KCTC 2396) TaxID=349521 RepID=Q2SQ00_HAHCH|nr:hypothetical protein [Hahella chejuensis]ABC27274.1 hypothetical protein HCH_00362 [Hahella chejuensis KCTC 2396]
MGFSYFIVAAVLSASCSLEPPELTQPLYRVAVIDRFYPGDESFASEEDKDMDGWLNGMVDLDRDRKREPLYHGDIVSLLASAPQVAVTPYPLTPGQPAQAEILRQLAEVRKHVFWGEPIDAVVLSWESSTLISAFEKPLRSENVESYKAVVRSWAEHDPVWSLSYRIIRLMEDLAETGVQVYTIAGNGGRGMVNTYSFADGVVTVGAVEEELGDFIADNELVDTHDQAAYFFRLVLDVTGAPVGYDVDGDDCADVPVTCLTGYSPERTDYPTRPWPPLKGSSFAAPMALRRHLLGDQSHRCSGT